MTIFVVMPDVIRVLLVVIVRLEFCMGTYFSFRSWLYFVVYVMRFICVSATLILGNVFFFSSWSPLGVWNSQISTVLSDLKVSKFCMLRSCVQLLRGSKVFENICKFLCIKVLQLSCCFYSRIYQWPCDICMVLKSAYIIFLNLSDGCF